MNKPDYQLVQGPFRNMMVILQIPPVLHISVLNLINDYIFHRFAQSQYKQYFKSFRNVQILSEKLFFTDAIIQPPKPASVAPSIILCAAIP